MTLPLPDFNRAEWDEQHTSCPTCLSRSQKYNGYTNYETWLVKLWLDNDQSTQEYWLEVAGECKAEQRVNKLTGQPTGAYDLSLRLHEELADEVYAGGQANMMTDLLTSALGSVNWYEIASHLIEDASELAEQEDA